MKSITANDVSGLSIPERIRLVGDIWDTIAEVPETLELTDSQRQELDRRLEAYHKNPNEGSPWSEVKARIQG
jgi:putative addiction module component (TIGR02574 family)